MFLSPFIVIFLALFALALPPANLNLPRDNDGLQNVVRSISLRLALLANLLYLSGDMGSILSIHQRNAD